MQRINYFQHFTCWTYLNPLLNTCYKCLPVSFSRCIYFTCCTFLHVAYILHVPHFYLLHTFTCCIYFYLLHIFACCIYFIKIVSYIKFIKIEKNNFAEIVWIIKKTKLNLTQYSPHLFGFLKIKYIPSRLKKKKKTFIYKSKLFITFIFKCFSLI